MTNLTAATMAEKIGTIMEWTRDGITFHVRIVDVRPSYGRLECKITPIAGQGSRWVREENLRSLHAGGAQ